MVCTSLIQKAPKHAELFSSQIFSQTTLPDDEPSLQDSIHSVVDPPSNPPSEELHLDTSDESPEQNDQPEGGPVLDDSSYDPADDTSGTSSVTVDPPEDVPLCQQRHIDFTNRFHGLSDEDKIQNSFLKTPDFSLTSVPVIPTPTPTRILMKPTEFFQNAICLLTAIQFLCLAPDCIAP